MAKTRKPDAWRNAITRYGDEDPTQLLANPANFRLHPKNQQDALSGALSELGWIAPVIVNETTQHVIDGHARIELAISRGEPTVPVAYVQLSEADERLALATFDPIGALAGQDDAMLTALLADLSTSDAGLSAMLRDLAPDVPKVLGEDTADLTPPAQPITKPGDLWLLGEHRLLCGDSTRREDVERLMGSERAVLFATDPPYLVDYDGLGHPTSRGAPSRNKDWSERYGVHWDESMAADDSLYRRFSEVALEHAVREDAAWYCWHGFRRQAMLEAVWQSLGVLLHQQIIWRKNQPILARTLYMWQHESCFYGWVSPHKPPRVSSETVTSVWDVAADRHPGEQTDHPTAKPVELFAIPMRQHTSAGDLCYEPFSGSGSQIVAAEQLGRRCFAMEIDARFVDVAIRRWENLTGQTAVLETNRKAVRDGAPVEAYP